MDKTAFYASSHSFYNIPSIIQHTGEITGVLSLVLLINDTGVLGTNLVCAGVHSNVKCGAGLDQSVSKVCIISR